jgi:hypothetical protein
MTITNSYQLYCQAHPFVKELKCEAANLKDSKNVEAKNLKGFKTVTIGHTHPDLDSCSNVVMKMNQLELTKLCNNLGYDLGYYQTGDHEFTDERPVLQAVAIDEAILKLCKIVLKQRVKATISLEFDEMENYPEDVAEEQDTYQQQPLAYDSSGYNGITNYSEYTEQNQGFYRQPVAPPWTRNDRTPSYSPAHTQQNVAYQKAFSSLTIRDFNHHS